MVGYIEIAQVNIPCTCSYENEDGSQPVFNNIPLVELLSNS